MPSTYFHKRTEELELRQDFLRQGFDVDVNFNEENSNKVVMLEYTGEKENVVIPEGITSIISLGTKGKDIKTVVIPSSVVDIDIAFKELPVEIIAFAKNSQLKQISDNSFEGCKNLQHLKIPKKVEIIGRSAFENCTKLTKMILPDNISTIQTNALCNCRNLTRVTMPKNLDRIEEGIFEDCTSLTHVTIPKSVSIISNSAFQNCSSLTRVTIPNGVHIIGNSAFQNCSSLTVADIPKSATDIGINAFSGCKRLTKITLPNGIRSINDSAFENCSSLTKITIPNGVHIIGNFAFQNCSSLTVADIPKSATDIGINAFSDCTSLTKIALPNGVRSINDSAFKNCISLANITIPDNVTTIRDNTFTNCRNLTHVTMSNNLTDIGSGAFKNCANLTNITIPKSVTNIGNQAFQDCKSLTNVIISEGMTSIGYFAFSGCGNLTDIIIPKSVTNIGGYAFFNCENLTNLTIPNNATNIGDGIFCGCSSLKEVTLELDDGSTVKIPWKREYQKMDLLKLRDFTIAKQKIDRTFLPSAAVINNIPEKLIPNFYAYSKNFARLFARSGYREDEPKADFFKLCLILGVFSNNKQERDGAETFIKEKIIGKYSEEEFHEVFTGFDTYSHGYSKEYADFLSKNYSHNFMNLGEGENQAGKELSLLSSSYNRFDEVKKAYPNNLAHNRNTQKDDITPEMVINVLLENNLEYKEGNEKLAKQASIYGYSQKHFDTMQELLEESKRIKPKQILKVKEDEIKDDQKIIYEFLQKDNILGLFLGNITNCCQRIGDSADSCVRNGYTDPMAGFVVFKKGDRIIGQSYLWYNERLKKVCLDNIEVPRSAKDIASAKDSEFVECLKRFRNNIKETMEGDGHPVEWVTTGVGYNDILDSVKKEFTDPRTLSALTQAAVQSGSQFKTFILGGSPHGVYTDTKIGEYIV